MEQRTRIDVEAPVEQVWEVLRDVERWPEWAPTVTSVRRLDDGPLAVGSRVRVEQPRIPPTEYVVTELEPSRSFTWVATGPGVRTTARHLLEELGTGRTRVTLAVEQAGPVGVVMGRFYRRLTDRYLTAEAERTRCRWPWLGTTPRSVSWRASSTTVAAIRWRDVASSPGSRPGVWRCSTLPCPSPPSGRARRR